MNMQYIQLVETIITVICSLIGLAIVLYKCVGKPMATVNINLINVNTNIKDLKDQLVKNEDKNSLVHDKLWEQISKLSEMLMQHTTWIDELRERTRNISE